MNIEFNPPLNMTFILLFLLFVSALIYIRISHCYCGMHVDKCKCEHNKYNNLYEGATGSIGQVALTPFQSQIPIEIPRPKVQNVQPLIPQSESLTHINAPIQQPIQQPTQQPHQTTIQSEKTISSEKSTSESLNRSQKENIQKPKFNWSTDPKVNEELRQQVMKDIEITKQKDINIIQTKPGTIQNVKITPESKHLPDETIKLPSQPIIQPPSPPPKKLMSGWILFGIFGGIWCLMVIIFIIVMIVKYRK